MPWVNPHHEAFNKFIKAHKEQQDRLMKPLREAAKQADDMMRRLQASREVSMRAIGYVWVDEPTGQPPVEKSEPAAALTSCPIEQEVPQPAPQPVTSEKCFSEVLVPSLTDKRKAAVAEYCKRHGM